MHDEQIRTEFSTWARELQATAPPPLAVLRRRTRRRTAARAVTAGVAAAAAAVALITLPRPGTRRPSRAWCTGHRRSRWS